MWSLYYQNESEERKSIWNKDRNMMKIRINSLTSFNLFKWEYASEDNGDV